jgi:GR25 family glycosyltransferase involved in LPS biosynthesis
MVLFSGIKIIIINLERRFDRKKLMEEKMKKINITDYIFFQGVDGIDDKYTKSYNGIFKKRKPPITRGGYGIILTYILLMDYLVQNKYERVIIFEDDISFHKNIDQLWETFDSKLFNQDIIWIGSNQTQFSDKQIDIIQKSKNYILPYFPDFSSDKIFGCYGIIMNKIAIIEMKKIFDMKKLSEMYCVDQMVCKLMRDKKLKGVILYPNLVIPDVTDSDNIGKRNQYIFCQERKIIIDNYDHSFIG